MILIDIPVVAYRTLGLEYRVYDENGKRNRELEREFEDDMKKHLASAYPYSTEHTHVR